MPAMIGAEDLQLLRECSRDEHAFERLQELFTRRAQAEPPSAPPADPGFDLELFLRQSIDVFVAYDTDLRYTGVNQLGASLLGKTPEQVVGRTNAELIGPGAAGIDPYLKQCFATESKVFIVHEIPTSAGPRLYDTVYTPVIDATGTATRAVGICRDVTEQKLRVQQLERTLAAQTSTLDQLSTPLLHIHEGILLVPLIGALDDRRTNQMTEVLLNGISGSGAHTAILDITGVSNVDHRVADALVAGARAARLLGARVVLTGVSPAVARTLVELGADLGGIATHGSLLQGFEAVLQR